MLSVHCQPSRRVVGGSWGLQNADVADWSLEIALQGVGWGKKDRGCLFIPRRSRCFALWPSLAELVEPGVAGGEVNYIPHIETFSHTTVVVPLEQMEVYSHKGSCPFEERAQVDCAVYLV